MATTHDATDDGEGGTDTETDGWAHIAGDFYWDGDRFPWWAWLAAAVLCLVFPPAGLFGLAFGATYSVRTSTGGSE